MRTQVIRRSNKVALLLMMFFTVFVSADIRAQGCCAKTYVPVAICSTGGTGIALPYFVCCQLVDYKGNHIWRNTWVATTCKNADARASYDMGCKRASPVYGMGSPIMGNCQFSYSTGRCNI